MINILSMQLIINSFCDESQADTSHRIWLAGDVMTPPGAWHALTCHNVSMRILN